MSRLPFVRPGPAPERVALYGAPNAGKTYAAWSIAKRLQQTNSPARMYYLDCDNSYWDMVDEFPDLENIIHLPFDLYEFSEFEDSVKKALDQADPQRQDWIVVDRGEPTWEAVQDAYSTTVRGVEIDEWRLQVRKNQSRGQDKDKRAGNTGFEWAEIKKMFRKPWTKLITSGCNVMTLFGETSAGSSSGDFATATKEETDMYGAIGKRPAGGAGVRELTHMFRDVIYLRCVSLKKEEFRATAAKARARREKLDNQPVKDMSMEFLFKVAGWKIAAQ